MDNKGSSFKFLSGVQSLFFKSITPAWALKVHRQCVLKLLFFMYFLRSFLCDALRKSCQTKCTMRMLPMKGENHVCLQLLAPISKRYISNRVKSFLGNLITHLTTHITLSKTLRNYIYIHIRLITIGFKVKLVTRSVCALQVRTQWNH